MLAIWGVNPDEAAEWLVDRLVFKHGTADAFAAEGYWFDSNSSSSTLEQTVHDVENKGPGYFSHPSIKTELGSRLFTVLDELDAARTAIDEQLFVRSLDVLFERSQAGDDFESDAKDHAHFIYRVCLASAIVDRFDFSSKEGSLNGLRAWLVPMIGEATAGELTEPFYRLKKLRNQ